MTAKTRLEALWNEAVGLHRGGKPAEAERLYVQILAQNPQAAPVWNFLGVARAQQNRAADALTAFDKAVTLAPDMPDALAHRAATLWALGRFADAVPAYDKALARNPANPEGWNYRGGALAMLGRAEEALESFKRAVASKPDYVDALNNLGVTQQGLKHFTASLESFDRAVALQPGHGEVLNNRGVTLSEMERFDEALASIEKALAILPGYAEAHYNHGGVLADLGRYEEALASYGQAVRLKPDYAEAQYNQSLCLLLLGRTEGWRHYEWRKRRNVPMTLRSHAQPHWLGAEDISGKSLFLYWEQGLGDTIQLCRYAPAAAARGMRVTLSVQKPLLRLLQQFAPAVEVIGEHDTPPQFDFQSSLMSLPLAFSGDIPTAPYLKADAELVRQWQARLPPRTRPRIGLVWSGGADHKNDRNRSLALEQILPLLGPEAEWFCLQKEIRPADQALFDQQGGVHFFGTAQTDFADTAALIELMDLVISVDTSAAHLAGALGKPVWILLPWRPDWRWLLGRGDTPWYPSARLFRQEKRGDWAGVIAALKAALNSEIYPPA